MQEVPAAADSINICQRYPPRSTVNIFAEAALLDPAYIKTAPQFVLDTGAMDALSHGIETSLNVNSNFMNRQVAMIGFGLFKKFKDHLLSGELTDEDFDNIMLHSSIMGMAFYQAGTLLPHGLRMFGALRERLARSSA